MLKYFLPSLYVCIGQNGWGAGLSIAQAKAEARPRVTDRFKHYVVFEFPRDWEFTVSDIGGELIVFPTEGGGKLTMVERKKRGNSKVQDRLEIAEEEWKHERARLAETGGQDSL